jgi:4'-phosphopantetheinyl transferase
MTGQRSAPLPLDGKTVHVWLVASDAIGDDLLRRYQALLAPVERERWLSFRVRGAAIQYLIGRALLRTSLSRYAPVPADAWIFETNAYGCPYLAAPLAQHGLRFNLSHTDGLVACAVSRGGDVGVDVENATRDVDPLSLAPTVFATPEIADIEATVPAERAQRFFAYWTLKEAYIKARGMGVSLALDGFWFDLDRDPPRIHFGERCPDRPERWHFSRCRPTPAHALAIAVAPASGAEPQLRLRWIVPPAPADGRAVETCAARDGRSGRG